MDIASGAAYPANALSNFAPHPFEIDGVRCASMEGFLQSLKAKEPDIQKHICSLVGRAAKSAGHNRNWQSRGTVYWQGKAICRYGDEYQQLLDRAYRALFEQNEGFRNALRASKGATLTHRMGKRKQTETILTTWEFCRRLTKLRDEL